MAEKNVFNPEQKIKKQVSLYQDNPEIPRPGDIMDVMKDWVDEHGVLSEAATDVYLSLLMQRLVGADPDKIDKSEKSSDLRLQVDEFPVYSIKAQGGFVRDERGPRISEKMMENMVNKLMPEYIKKEKTDVEAVQKRTDGDYDFAATLNINPNFDYNTALKDFKDNNNKLEFKTNNEEPGGYFLKRPQYLIEPNGNEFITLSRFRINASKAQGKFIVIIRKIDSEIPDFFDLKLNPKFLQFINYEKGIVLVTGPTGSGKSTTLAAMINEINKTYRRHIVTMENPVEFVHPNKLSFFTQRDIPTDSKSFDSALKSALRQAPDVILFGEMRDPETIKGALEAAETGHLVFATLHTSGAAKTIDRIVSTFPSDEQDKIAAQLATSFVGVISQLLVKTVDGGITTLNEMVVGNASVRGFIKDREIGKIGSAAKNDPITHLSLVAHAYELIRDKRVTQDAVFGQIYRNSPDDYGFLVKKLKEENLYIEEEDFYSEAAMKKKMEDFIEKIKKLNGVTEDKKVNVDSGLSESAKVEQELESKSNKMTGLLLDD